MLADRWLHVCVCLGSEHPSADSSLASRDAAPSNRVVEFWAWFSWWNDQTSDESRMSMRSGEAIADPRAMPWNYGSTDTATRVESVSNCPCTRRDGADIELNDGGGASGNVRTPTTDDCIAFHIEEHSEVLLLLPSAHQKFGQHQHPKLWNATSPAREVVLGPSLSGRGSSTSMANLMPLGCSDPGQPERANATKAGTRAGDRGSPPWSSAASYGRLPPAKPLRTARMARRERSDPTSEFVAFGTDARASWPSVS
ncbi:hypothetical protein EVG20_g7935 [Dentipellis fragilis]|uniref:Uncharacterized protein n=1 Tax=Dentipellis fragilis TaxID=205917 RepID=A0A4Y9YAW7_9AGAM|nr:hypothetical protein EVG20_g7935 [Dentipellis fragilis]